MTEFVSDIKEIPYSREDIFPVLSDLTSLDLVKDKLPEDKIKNLSFDKDSCTINVSPVGDITFEIVERTENDTIKFQGKNTPVEVFFWIQLLEKDANDSKMKLTIKADLNVFLKPMLSKPLSEGIQKIAEVLAKLPYKEIMDKKNNKNINETLE